MIRAQRPLLLVLAALFCMVAPGAGRAAGATIDVPRPAAGETLTIDVPPEATLLFQFHPLKPAQQETGDNLVLSFPDGGRVVLKGFLAAAQMASVQVSYEGVAKPAKALLQHETAARPSPPPPTPKPVEPEPDTATDAQPAAGGTAEPSDLPGLHHTGRDLLFSGELEQSGHPLYSYLLYAGGAAAGVEHDRFARAVEAFVRQVSSAAALEASGAARSEINIFYAPMKPIFQDTTPENMRIHFAQLSEDEQIALLLQLYDRARAEVLIGRAGLTGKGPFIVSVLRPLTATRVDPGAAFLVQNLSDVPPDLVALWVDEFKRQVVQEAAGTPEDLRRFALNLRTKIAVLAEGFAITKSAVAAMFEAPNPAETGGNGN